MHREPEVVGAFEIAGIACALECGDAGFRRFLAARYADFATDAPAELALRVAVSEAAPPAAAGSWTGPFARIGGDGDTLAIRGATFRGEFHEPTGRGWIEQSPDPNPLETFLTAIYAARLLTVGGFLLHAAAVDDGDGAHVFFGPSESGKTTVADLIGRGVITDEIAVIRPDAGGYRVSAVPWRGRRLAAPLAGLYRLRKARETAFRPLASGSAVRELLGSVFFPRADAVEVSRFLQTAADLLARVPCHEMRFTPDGAFWPALPRREKEGRCPLTTAG